MDKYKIVGLVDLLLTPIFLFIFTVFLLVHHNGILSTSSLISFIESVIFIFFPLIVLIFTGLLLSFKLFSKSFKEKYYKTGKSFIIISLSFSLLFFIWVLWLNLR